MTIQDYISKIVEVRRKGNPVHLIDSKNPTLIRSIKSHPKESFLQCNNVDSVAWKKYYPELLKLEVEKCETSERGEFRVYIKGFQAFLEEKNILLRW